MTTHRNKRRGFSLMMVTAVVAVASAMGMAILSASTLQAEASANQDKVVAADALAESGVNLAAYYLQNFNDTTKCPLALTTLATGTATWSQTGNSLGSSVSGTFDLTFTRPSTTEYIVTSVGKVTTTDGTISRTIVATLEINYYGNGINAPNTTSSLTIPANTTVTGGVYSASGGTGGTGVSGLISSLTSTVGKGTTQVLSTTNVAHYLTYTNIDGKSGVATAVVSGSYSNVTWGPTATNPAGVYYCLGNLDLNGNVKVNGTVVCASGGSLRIQGTGNSITAARYFPAAVVEGDIKIKATNSSLDITGLTYVGANISKAGSGSVFNLKIIGTLLLANAAPTIDSNVTLTVYYDRYKAAVPSLTGATKPVPTSVSISSWKN